MIWVNRVRYVFFPPSLLSYKMIAVAVGSPFNPTCLLKVDFDEPHP